MVGYVELIGCHVAITHGYDARIALQSEVQIVLCRPNTTSFAVDSSHSQVLQVGAIGLPIGIIGFDKQSYSLASRLYLVASHLLSTGSCYGYDAPWLIFHVVPA